jgi:hypothetical protein
MKKFFIALCALALWPPMQAHAQGFGLDEDRRIVKIGASARAVLQDYLAKEYHQQCQVQKQQGEICRPAKALYENSALPRQKQFFPLPEAVSRKIGFTEPGTAYVQSGFAVYLIRLPRNIVLDSVMAWDGG